MVTRMASSRRTLILTLNGMEWVPPKREGRSLPALSANAYFFLAYFMESSATASMMMPPLMMNCQ
ncbi:hypothetical protein D3C85_952650 [compost metagenome]